MFKAEQCGFPARCAALLKLCSQQCGVEVGRPVAVWQCGEVGRPPLISHRFNSIRRRVVTMLMVAVVIIVNIETKRRFSDGGAS